jgi:hypothetical protein
MDIHLLRKDDPLESGAIYQYITVQARARKVAASDILEAALIFLRWVTSRVLCQQERGSDSLLFVLIGEHCK